MPELRHLRVFVAVAEERNFTRAAARLHLAQQAVSKVIAQLEGELGVELLERTTREVRLTAAGTALLESGRDVLAAVDGAFARARDIGHGLSGRVRIGASPAVGRAAAQRVVAALRDGTRDLAISIREIRPGEVARVLAERDVDIVLARTLRPTEAVDSAPLASTESVLAVPAEHPLAHRAGAVTPGDLDGERLLVWSAPGTPYTDLLVGRLAAAGATVEPVEARVTGAAELTELSECDCVAIMPAGQPPADGVVFVPFAESLPLPLLVAWPAGAPPAAAARLRERLPPP